MILRPCRKCGGAAVIHTGWDTEYIECSVCGAKTEVYVGDYYDEGFMDGSFAAQWWNDGKIKERET